MRDAAKNLRRARVRPLDGATLSLTVLGLGFLRPAPGTWGSMPAPGAAGLLLGLGFSKGVVLAALGCAVVAASAACVAFGRYAERRFGSKDAAEVVADEAAGSSLAMLAAVWMLPELPGNVMSWVWAGAAGVAAFFFFRVFDIVKPPPARRLEGLPHGWGVLMDDLMAGVYAAAAAGAAVAGLGAVA
ncbi:MAG: phosphatidylglycerophosphatase A [Planctomycetota bacterium]|nr:phosphatidylglycerophosphatase A [Planctomycetota bacterium]